jgi:hypothetical protein
VSLAENGPIRQDGDRFRGEKIIPIHVSANKVSQRFSKVMSIYSAWNTLSFVQVVEFPAQGKDPSGRTMFIDSGTAATGIDDLRPDVRTVIAGHPDQVGAESTIAYVGKRNPKILIIGSGGGSQVLEGLKAGASSITAVEINSIINDIVAVRMNDYWGNLYHQPEVHLVTDEGRSVELHPTPSLIVPPSHASRDSGSQADPATLKGADTEVIPKAHGNERRSITCERPPA